MVDEGEGIKRAADGEADGLGSAGEGSVWGNGMKGWACS
jgi:hypothetical protein